MNEYQTAIELMQSMLNADESVIASFNKRDYRKKFDEAYHKWLPGFDALGVLYGSVKEPDALLDNMSAALVQSAAAKIESITKKRDRQGVLDNLNLQMVVYVFPAILHYNSPYSKPLTEKISTGWKEQFPKTNLTPAELEYIEKGFQRKFCYITSAVCTTLGKGDHCRELDTFRAYRDTYLASSEEGEQLISNYYDVAPTIVKHIDSREDSREIYNWIWETYLKECLDDIDHGRKEECRLNYIRMVNDLKETYFLS